MTQQLQDRYIVRMPDGMRDKIKEEASRNHRSMNAEIVHHLSKAYGTGETEKPAAQS